MKEKERTGVGSVTEGIRGSKRQGEIIFIF